jgi:predicted dinucleotide-binding enzyme
MRITVIGRGHVGGALARRWTAAGHEVTTIGRDGGDATGAEVVVVAIPGDSIAAGLAKVAGLDGQVTIDATNTFGDRPSGYDSIARQVNEIIGGPTAKAFNTNFASIYDAVDAEPIPPGTLFASEAGARETTEHLIRDAGFEPIHLGDLAQAPLLESLIALTATLDRGDLGPFFYRFHRPGELAARLSDGIPAGSEATPSSAAHSSRR